MSVEAGISTGIASAGISSGGFSSEMGSAPSFSVGTLESFSTPSFGMPAVEAEGGSFVPNMTMESLFSETVPFIASEGRSFDRPIGNPDAVFSQKSDFLTIAENVKSSKEDTMSNLFKDTMPFVPTLESISERVSLHDAREILGNSINKSSGNLQEGEWVTVAKTKSEDFKPFEPQPVILDKIIDIDFSELGIVTTSQAPEQELRDVNQPQKASLEIKEEDMAQAKKVTDVLISLGTEKEEAEKQVLEIVRETNRKNEVFGQIVSEKVEPEVLSQQAAAVTNIREVENDQEGDEEEIKKKEKQISKKKKEKQKPPVLEVDNSAQGSRKSAFGVRLSEAFKTAREKGLGVVRGKDAVQGLTEKRADKSQLLIQAGLSNVPDGSFHEVADEIGDLEIRDTSLMGEIYARIMVNLIVDGKPAIRASDTSSSEPVTEEDERRVTKFINSSTIPSH
jgi:hypothetical protein